MLKFGVDENKKMQTPSKLFEDGVLFLVYKVKKIWREESEVFYLIHFSGKKDLGLQQIIAKKWAFYLWGKKRFLRAVTFCF